MRQDTQNYIDRNKSSHREPRYVVELSFDAANTDTHFFTSHDDIDLPGGSSVTHRVLKSLSGTSQKINPEEGRSSIGDFNFELLDKSNAVRDLLSSKLSFGKSIRGMRTVTYSGWKDLDWADYTVVATQNVRTTSYRDAVYSIVCNDLQREARKEIFVPFETTLSQTIDSSQLLIPVASVTGLEYVAHGPSFTDAPNQTVAYIRVDDERIRVTGDVVDGTLGLCFVANQRGALNTRAVEHKVDATAPSNRRKKVTEYVYLELPAMKLVYALLTGDLYNQPGETLPASWHLGIDASLIETSDFLGLGPDLWDPANDNNGMVAYFDGLKKTDGKKFIEQQLLLLTGTFFKIYNNGKIGVQRMPRVTRDASYVRELNEDNIVSYGTLSHDMQDVINVIDINWNWDDLAERYARTDTLYDNDSISIYGETPRRVLSFRGLSGNRHSIRTLENQFNALRDGSSGEPLTLDLTLLPSQNDLEIGDIVRVKLPQIHDYVTGGPLDRSFQVRSVDIQWRTGLVKVSLFGASRLASEINTAIGATVLPDAWYSSEGAEIEAYIAANYPGNFSLVGQVGHITGDVVLSGDPNANAAGAIYYYAGDLQIDSGVTVTITENVQLRVMGNLTINGKIDGKGQGIAANGGAGFIGTTLSVGGYVLVLTGGAASHVHVKNSFPGTQYIGQYQSSPFLALENDGSTLFGIPNDLRGSAGGQGGSYNYAQGIDTYWPGGNGGSGGSGFAVVSRGASFGAAGQIDVSGVDGIIGGIIPSWNGLYRSGTGGGGHPGAVYFLLDGVSAVTPILTNIIAQHGRTDPAGTPFDNPGIAHANGYQPKPFTSYYTGIDNGDRRDSCVRIQFIPEYEAANQDPGFGELTPPTNLQVFSGTNELIVEADGTVIVRARLTWTPSSDERVVGYNLQYKRSSDSDYFASSDVLGADSTQGYVANLQSNVSYDFRVASADGFRHISDWVYLTNYIVLGKSQPPADVPSFSAIQNGNVVVLKWGPVNEPDLLGYEIRYNPAGDTNWNNGTVLTKATRGTNVTSADLPDGNWTLMIKAIDTSGNYSVNALNSTLNFVSDYDVITQQPQAPDWPGTLTGLVKHWTGKLLIADQNPASFYDWEVFDQYVPTPVAVAEYEAPEIDIGFDDEARCWGDVISVLGPGESSGLADPQLQLDYRLSAGAYDGFENWSVGNATGRFFKFKFSIDTAQGLPVITGFKPTVDNLEFEQKGNGVVIPAGGLTINFPVAYHGTPYVRADIIGTGGLIANIESITTTGFTVRVYSNTSDVGGTINWRSEGV